MRTVLLDVDGVLADFVGGYFRLLEEHTGIVARREQITQFDMGASLGLTPEQASKMKRAIGDAHQFARTLDVYPGAVDGVRRLQEIADVWIVTSPWNSNPTWTHDREWWLKKHFDIPHARVTHTSAKHMVRGDFLVDDKTDTLVKWREANPMANAVLWAGTWNEHDAWAGVRTDDWARLVSLVEAVP